MLTAYEPHRIRVCDRRAVRTQSVLEETATPGRWGTCRSRRWSEKDHKKGPAPRRGAPGVRSGLGKERGGSIWPYGRVNKRS